MTKIMQAMPGASPQDAVSVAMRVCAGCTDGAKGVRKTEMNDLPTGGRGEREIQPDERATYAHFLSIEAQSDRVYAAGVAIGPPDQLVRLRLVYQHGLVRPVVIGECQVHLMRFDDQYQ